RSPGCRVGSRLGAATCGETRGRPVAPALGRDRRGRADDRLQLVRLRQTAAASDRERARRMCRARPGSALMNFSMFQVLPWIEWVAASALGQAISKSSWAFAVIESVHLLALAVIGGAVLMVDLRLLGFGLRADAAGGDETRRARFDAVVVWRRLGRPLDRVRIAYRRVLSRSRAPRRMLPSA